MKGLLDTHAFIWWDANSARLSSAALAFLNDPANIICLSVVSVWEIFIKQQLGKLTLATPLRTILTQQQAAGLQILPVSLDHVFAVETLAIHHKHPFDRLMIAQAIVENASLISNDAVFSTYPVSVVW